MLTLELDFEFNEEFQSALKHLLPRGARFFDYHGNHKWYALPEYEGRVIKLAYEHFPLVYATKDGETVEVRSGWKRPKRATMFG